MKNKIVSLGIVSIFVMALVGMLPVSMAGTSVPDELYERPYYWAADKHLTPITSAEQFGQVSGTGLMLQTSGKFNTWANYQFHYVFHGLMGGDQYIAHQFDCSEWATHMEWFLENMGFNTRIVEHLLSGGATHAYVHVELSDGWHTYDGFEIQSGCVDKWPISQASAIWEDVYGEAAEHDCDWWDSSVSWGVDMGQRDLAILPAYNPPNPAKPGSGIFRNGLWAFVDGERFGWGVAGDIPVVFPNGDRGIFRNGMWRVQGRETTYWGLTGDYPVIRPDGIHGIFRNGEWKFSDGEHFYWGVAGDIPVVFPNGDYGIFRNGMWRVQGRETTYWGLTGDKPIVFPDGKYGIYRNGMWRLTTGETFYFGAVGDYPVVKQS